MSWFYIILVILLLYYTGLYAKLPPPFPELFDLITICYPAVNDDIEGVYESDFMHHGFHKHFMITVDPVDDAKYIALKYRGSKSETDDTKKLLEKEIREMKQNALNSSYQYKTPVIINKKEKKYEIFGISAIMDGTTIIFDKDGKTVKYFKIRNI